MEFPVEVYLADTSKDQVNGTRVATAKNNKALKALKAGGYTLENPDKESEAKPKEVKKEAKAVKKSVKK